jgi:hypothetical protein
MEGRFFPYVANASPESNSEREHTFELRVLRYF